MGEDHTAPRTLRLPHIGHLMRAAMLSSENAPRVYMSVSRLTLRVPMQSVIDFMARFPPGAGTVIVANCLDHNKG